MYLINAIFISKQSLLDDISISVLLQWLHHLFLVYDLKIKEINFLLGMIKETLIFTIRKEALTNI
jgi:hypothetical protein